MEIRTVGDLVAELSKHSPDLLVVVDGYEGGTDFISNIEEVRIKPYANTAWYYGSHEIVDTDEAFGTAAVYIAR